MDFINKKDVIDRPYIAGFKDQKVALYARSLAAAKQTAVEHFRPKKRDKGLLWVELVDRK
jgi:hypothetical protein